MSTLHVLQLLCFTPEKQTKEIKPFFPADLRVAFFIASSDPELTRFPVTVNWSVEDTVYTSPNVAEFIIYLA